MRSVLWSFFAAQVLIGSSLAGQTAPSTAPQSARDSAQEVVLLRAASIVHPVLAEYLTEGIAEAERRKAAAVVIVLDTPGGLMESTREIAEAVQRSKVPVVVWVGPAGARAASAGFFLLMSADLAAMAPSTNTGAAHPVGSRGEEIPGPMGDKVLEDAAATIRALATERGRNPTIAESAVRESRSFTASEALAAGLIDLEAADLPALLAAIDGKVSKRGGEHGRFETEGAPLHEIEMAPWRRFLATLADPNIAFALLVLGGLGLYFELMHPGAILPGVVGAISLVLAFWGLSVLPVRTAGVALVLLALVFFVAEIKIVSYGLLTVAGIASLVLGGLLLFKSPEPALAVSLRMIVGFTGLAALVVGFLAWRAVVALRLPVRSGREGMLTERGIARTEIAKTHGGKVFVRGEIWDAVLNDGHDLIRVGEQVEIVAVDGLKLEVRRVAAADS